jgi:hypothetical protein
VRYFCLRDPRAFAICDQSGRCGLHFVAQYSNSVELLQSILQVDCKMTEAPFDPSDIGSDISTLGLLCSRSEFPTFDRMVSCLIEVDSSIAVNYDGVIGYLRMLHDCCSEYNSNDIPPGSRGERSLIFFGELLDANPSVIRQVNSNIFHVACRSLSGVLGVSVISLLLIKDSTVIRAVNEGYLPIHMAARNSCLDVVKLVLRAYPESVSMRNSEECNSLHLAAKRFSTAGRDIMMVESIIMYLC